MRLCAVITCKCSQEGHDGEAEGLSFHPFPTNAELKAKWVEMTGRNDWTPTSHDYICSRHFRENDYTIKRSQKRYLKTSALPCEYVVYRNLYGEDEDVEVKLEAEDSSTDTPAPASDAHDVEPEEPGTSGSFAGMNLQPGNQEPDSTFGIDEWERFRPERYFGERLPISIFEDHSQDVGSSSGFDERYRRDVGSSSNPYPPIDLQQLPPPGSPERPASSAEEKLDRIGKIIAKRKTSKKATKAKHAEIREVQKIKILLQSGQMSDCEKATGIISIQTKQIEKLTIKHRRQKNTIKRISAVLRNVEISFYFINTPYLLMRFNKR